MTDRQDLVDFIDEMLTELRSDDAEWENDTLPPLSRSHASVARQFGDLKRT